MTSQGLREAIRNLQELSGAVYGDVVKVLQETGDSMADQARSIVPVRTGRLQASISCEHTSEGAEVRATMGYAGYVNFGTRKMSPRPFMTNAMENAEASIKGLMKEKLE